MKEGGFTFLFSWAEIVEGLPAEVRLELYDAIIRYAHSGTVSQLKPMARLAFGFIRKDIDAEFGGSVTVPHGDGDELFPDYPAIPVQSEEEKEKLRSEREAKKAAEAELQRKIDYLYGLYPTKSMRAGREVSTGKCSKDKERIRRLLAVKTVEEIETVIRSYVDECGGSYLKNFSTFLNNLPESGNAGFEQPANKPECHRQDISL